MSEKFLAGEFSIIVVTIIIIRSDGGVAVIIVVGYSFVIVVVVVVVVVVSDNCSQFSRGNGNAKCSAKHFSKNVWL